MNGAQKVLLKILSVSLFSSNHVVDHPDDIDNTNASDNWQEDYSPLISTWCASATPEDWKDLMDEAIQQGVYLLVFSVVKHNLKDILSSTANDKYERLFLEGIFFNVQNSQDHRNVGKLMSENGIPYVILKGQASGRYYPIPKYRHCGDVDFLVNKNDIEHTGKLLESVGLKRTKDKDHKCHIAFYDRHLAVEMHWQPGGVPDGDKGQICIRYLKNIIESARAYDGMMVPDDFHHGIVLLLHTAVHVLNTGLGLRHLCDWAVYIDKVDVSQYKSQLQEMGLWRFAELLTQVSVIYLGVKNQSWAMGNLDKSLLEEIIEDFLASGEFGIKDPERINEAKLMTTSTQGNVGNNLVAQFFRMLTEKSKKALHTRHNASLMIPLGWFYVGIRHMIRIRNGKRPPIHFQKMIKGARTRREIYKRFELFE